MRTFALYLERLILTQFLQHIRRNCPEIYDEALHAYIEYTEGTDKQEAQYEKGDTAS